MISVLVLIFNNNSLIGCVLNIVSEFLSLQGGVPHQAHAARGLCQVVGRQQVCDEWLRRNEHPLVEG